ncbi:RNA polymerase sigma factor [Peribacillus sp. NPDC096540]|uniref:RNA polymerase sigma factor n=1 Tax=Peribacillus sp. NPDC096540 TaxID=3390612 RepID=UPI003D07B6AA
MKENRYCKTEDFTLVYQSFYERIYYIALAVIKCPFLAEDITQETYIKAYKKLHTINNREKLGAWLACIATRTAIDFSRKQKRGCRLIQQEMVDWVECQACRQVIVENAIDIWTLKEDVSNLLCKLTQKQRQILLLKVNRGLKEHEIASILEINQATVKVNLYRARKQLKYVLKMQAVA